MRWIVGIAAMLFCLGWVACQIELALAAPIQSQPDDGWRRTTLGWERLAPVKKDSTRQSKLWQAHPHPLTATLFYVMLSVLLLVAFTEAAAWHAAPSPNSPASHLPRPATE